MRRFILLLSISFFSFFILNAQSYWSTIEDRQIQLRSDQQRDIIPDQYVTISLRLTEMQSYLSKAKSEIYSSNQKSNVHCTLPLPDGTEQVFEIFRTNNMMAKISAKYPNIQSYVGYAKNGDNARFDFSTFGFHGAIKTQNGTVYIDPFATEDKQHYISYFTANHTESEDAITTCGLDEVAIESERSFHSHISRSEEIPLHTYRLALACTGNYGAWFNNKEEVLANMNTGVNRLNLIFINELSIKVEIIDENEEIMFMDSSTDPYPSGREGRKVLPLNTGVINQRIGPGSYDLGHVFTLSCTDGVGGIAYRPSVCGFNKGGGVTCIYNPNNITASMVNIASHEMGHQFGANHSFNNCSNDGNESSGTAYEPGSGSTIMSYAGACGSNNIAGTNDDYYFNYSIEEMALITRIGSGSGCGSYTEIGNHKPVASHNYTNGTYVPIETPFLLKGVATDEDGDDMTYSWEQMDKGPLVPLGQPSENSPLFRSIYPDGDNTRSFPKLETVRYNGFDRLEVLPTYSRDLTFRFIVRDNHPGGGLLDWKEVKFLATDEAGPFKVTYPNDYNLSFQAGKPLEITWDVANTNGSKVNTQFVDIILSINDGISFPYKLVEKVPNTGVYTVVLPNHTSPQSRIMIAAYDNIFYDISNRSFEITEPETGFYFNTNAFSDVVCLPTVSSFELNTFGFGTFSNPINFEVVNQLPEGVQPIFTNNDITPNNSTTLEIDMNNTYYNGEFSILIRGVSEGADTIYQTLRITSTSNDFSALKPTSPADNSSGVSRAAQFDWKWVADATAYKFELATNPAFGDYTLVEEEGLIDSFYLLKDLIAQNSIYYWRVTGSNKCSEFQTETFAFSTIAKYCQSYTAINLPKNITQSGTPTVEAIFDIPSSSTVLDVNVIKVKINHGFVSDLSGSLVSPSGTEKRLWHRKCTNLSLINCGFDDESVATITCPMNNRIFQARDSLSHFNGETIDGQWLLKVKDNVAGDGGTFNEAILEICTESSLNNPYIINNNALGVKPSDFNNISSLFLKVGDDDNSDDELIFTLITLPIHGELSIGNITATIGAQFSQSDINNNKIKYSHNGNDAELDEFKYTVIDGEGGWISKTIFEINIGEEYPSEIVSIELSNIFNIFPNPTQNLVTIEQLNPDILRYDVTISDMKGNTVLVKKSIHTKSINLDLSFVSSGIYLVKIIAEEDYMYQKLSIIK